jgi:hypothetical protein
MHGIELFNISLQKYPHSQVQCARNLSNFINSGICILYKLLTNARERFTGLLPLFGSSVTLAGVCVGGRS